MITKELAKLVLMGLDPTAWKALKALVDHEIHALHLELEYKRGDEAAEARGGIQALRQLLKAEENVKLITKKD
jgi:hypothetical protein